MCTRVLVLLALQVVFAYCITWDIVVSEGKWLQFYNNGTLTHIEGIQSAKEIYSITYDPVHFRILFVDGRDSEQLLSSFDLSTRNIQRLVTRTSGNYLRVAYDPVTQILFWVEGWMRIYSFSLNSACTNKAVDGNLIVTLNQNAWHIAVDSCGGYMYWVTDYGIERARFDGSQREVLINNHIYYRFSLAFDQQTQKMYWIEKKHSADKHVSIVSADFNGKNNKTLYIVKNETHAGSLTISKDFIYWNGIYQKAIGQLPKNLPQQLEAKVFSTSSNVNWYYHVIAANYTLKDQLRGNQNCETLKSLIPNESEPDCKDAMLCVYGTKVSGESRCECTQGYTGEKCEISVCQNYCFQGNCSVSAEGQPKCSCNAGYFGERCELNACHKHCLHNGVCSLNEEDSPICQCTIDYEGERCDVPICKDYCFQGNCNVSAEGQPICSCTDGYSGERCEFNACHDYCLNNGICSLNEEDSLVCQCTADYEGERCDIAVTRTGINGDNISQPILRDLRREVKQVIKEELQRTLRSEVKQVQVIKEELQSTLRSEVNQVQVIKEELQSTLRSEVNQVQVIKEDLQRTLRFYSDKNDENEVKIQKCEKSIKDLENQSVGLENHDEITPKTFLSNTFSETN